LRNGHEWGKGEVDPAQKQGLMGGIHTGILPESAPIRRESEAVQRNSVERKGGAGKKASVEEKPRYGLEIGQRGGKKVQLPHSSTSRGAESKKKLHIDDVEKKCFCQIQGKRGQGLDQAHGNLKA